MEKIFEMLGLEKLDESKQADLKETLKTVIDVKAIELAESKVEGLLETEKDKLKEHPSREEANGYLTKKKRRHLKDENVKLRSTDILCCRCWIKCERAAVAIIEELLQAQKKI